jgi:hypothetical protein
MMKDAFQKHSLNSSYVTIFTQSSLGFKLTHLDNMFSYVFSYWVQNIIDEKDKVVLARRLYLSRYMR